MATKPGVLSEWPWQRMGNYKYLLFAPYAAAAAYEWGFQGKANDFIAYNAHIGAIAALRYVVAQIWTSIARFPWLVGKYQISSKGIDFKQVDREDSWDDFILFNSLGLTLLGLLLPGWQSVPLFNGHGLVVMLLLHASVAEWLYYWFHRALHHHWLYTRYHSHHHQSFVTEPITGSVHPFLEHVGYIAIFAMPGVLTYVGGQGSIAMIYAYLLTFDFLNGLGHCNFEFIPTWLFKAFPPLKYLIYTPSYHSLHHTRVHTNFSLFMPLYDYLYGTVDNDSDTLYEQTIKGAHPGPDAIFLAHGMDVGSFVHGCFGIRGLASHPYCPSWVLYPFIPLATLLTIFFWLIDLKPWAVDRRSLRGNKLELWTVPRMGLQYFFSSERPKINRLILQTLKECDANGVKVFGLGALNKSEALNQGGEIYRADIEGMRMRVVHGNTLTAAAILHRLPQDCDEIFLTGGTSKLGRAIALYLVRKGVRVLLHTKSQERFQAIVDEAAPEHRKHLVWSPNLADGSHCKNWVVGRWHSRKEQAFAPAGTHFHQFVVPLMTPARKDCTYSKQICMRMPKDTQGLGHCELNLQRNTVHACHAAVIVHLLEGWDFHELGSINVDRIDENWEAALKHGFEPVS